MFNRAAKLAAQLIQQTVLDNPYIPFTPTVKQAEFLIRPEQEVLFGGSAGPGKSAALLMSALQFVEQTAYSALLLRRTFTDLSLPGALIDMSHAWLKGTPAAWDGQLKQWRFPSGASLSFGYLDNAADQYRYQSSSFQFIGWDELSQFDLAPYTYLFSRLRRLAGVDIPLRMRAASNPGGIGHEWVRERFIGKMRDGIFVPVKHADRVFIRATLDDNPHLDRESYERALDQLDPVTRAQLKHGNWHIRPEGNLFKRAWFKFVDRVPSEPMMTVRSWDLAATEGGDYAAGVRMHRTKDGCVYVSDVRREQGTPQAIEKLVKRTAKTDGKGVAIRFEQEPGSAGKILIDNYRRLVLPGFDVRGTRSTGDKVTRSGPWSAACEAGDVHLVRADWNEAYIDEHTAFPEVAHDDQVDASSAAFATLTHGNRAWTAETFEKITRREEDETGNEYHRALMEALGRD